jgi:glutamate synthase (NADPH/NADH) small chain
MGKVTGFIEIQRKKHPTRRVDERIHDWNEVYLPFPEEGLKSQAARCMDCGIPFCHTGCPLGNLIPDWNDLVYRDRWKAAIDRLHATNNFPEFTGRLCPAPCEGACVLGINDSPVTIKSVEVSIIDRAFEQGWVTARPPEARTGRRVAVVGSGPAGLAAAEQLNRAGHTVTVFERADRIGGLLRYGIPEFKLEKQFLDRRLNLMIEDGIEFRVNANIGVDIPVEELKVQFDAVVLAGGSTRPRDLPVPGRELKGIHFAMDYLTLQNRRNEGEQIPDDQFISAKDKHVIIIGGGDTGADCLGTAHRQGAKSVHQLELLSRPPDTRSPGNPWPLWPNVFRVSTAHEEGGERLYSISTQKFTGDDQGRVRTLHAMQIETVASNGRMEFRPVPGTEFELKAELVLLAMGFLGPETNGMIHKLGVKMTERGTVWRDERWMTSVPGVFTAGDMQRGQSLIVWAIAEGRSAARGVDLYLMGRSDLPAPVQ